MQSRALVVSSRTLGWVLSASCTAVNSCSCHPHRFFEFLSAAFPHKDHALMNKAISATNAGTFATCTERLVPAVSGGLLGVWD